MSFGILFFDIIITQIKLAGNFNPESTLGVNPRKVYYFINCLW